MAKEKGSKQYSKTRSRKQGGGMKSQHDGKKYKKFTGNKQEGQGFVDKRKTKMIHEYRKMKRKDQKIAQENVKILAAKASKGNGDSHKKGASSKGGKSQNAKISAIDKAQFEWKKKEDEIKSHQMERERVQKESADALARYQKKKKAKHKKLCVKNYKGQPNMASQMEILLKQIEAQKNS